jgi:chromosome segregation ATPase
MKLVKSVLLAGLLSVSVSVLAADDKTSAAKAQLRQVQQEKHKLEQEKGQLEQDKAALDMQLKAAQESLESVKKNVGASARRSAGLQKELDQTKAEKDELAGQVVALQKQLDESRQRLKQATDERRAAETAKLQVETNLGQQNQTLAACEAKNQEQYKVGLELLDKYQKKGCFTSMLQHEPFFGITETRIENEVAEFKEKLDKQHLPRPKDIAEVAP